MEKNTKAWVVTWCATGINLALGMIYSWSIFAAALIQDLGFSKTQAQLPYSIAILVLALLSVPGGRLQDRFGPRICATIGGLLAGSGLILAGFAESLLVLAISVGLITGSGIGLATAATTPAAVKWFSAQKRGLISGLVVAGVGLASLYVAPLTQYFIDKFGIKKAFWVEGIIFGIAIVSLAQFLAHPPKGYISEDSQEKYPNESEINLTRDFTPTEMLATPQFWLIWFMYGFGALAGLMIIGHMAIIAKIQAKVEWAFIFVSILALFNAAGRLLGGILSDKFGRHKVLMMMFILQAINMVLFKAYHTVPLLLMGIAITGIAYGALLSVVPALTFDYFGTKNGGINYGLVFTSWGVAGVVGPTMAGRIVDMTQSYNLAFMVAAGFLVISVLLVLAIKSPKNIEKKFCRA